MKQRFSSLDVRVIAHELHNSLCTLRLSNVYDLSSRIFLLKFAKPEHRQQLVIDSGFRCHLTTFARETAPTPSGFVTRLRKFLRSRRVTSVSQVGTDRILEVQFSDGQYKLFLEFYAGGNIILTDTDLAILALLRVVPEGPEQEELRVGLKYSLSNRQNYNGVPPLNADRIRNGLQIFIDKSEEQAKGPGKKSKTNVKGSLRRALAVSTTELPPTLIEHALRTSGFDIDTPPSQILQDDLLLDKLVASLHAARRVVQDVEKSQVVKGYIIAKPSKGRQVKQESTANGDEGQEATKRQDVVYEDFHPFLPQQFEDDPGVTVLSFDGFNKTVDEFFSSIESQKLESRLQEREDNAKRRLQAARKNHEQRLDSLQELQNLNVRKAQAIEANVETVEEAIGAVNSLIAQGMDWVEIARLIEMEQSRQNPVAEMIKLPLKLYENTITLALGEADDEADFSGQETDSDVSESDDETKPMPKSQTNRLAVDVDLGLSPWVNARQYYDQKRHAAVKQQKTEQSSSKALKSTEKKISADMKKELKQEKQLLRPVRKQLWFEKFIYFVSSDGYLVLGGKDMQQNDLLYRRYLKRGDIYVHADLHGAASVIIKNNPSTPDAPIPPATLSQAGNLSVATSNAWDSKAVMSAWWVKSDQVSKTAPTGEYLTTGGFMVRGHKNFLPPSQLLLGFGVMFHISDESKARHFKHRLQDETDSAVTDRPSSEGAALPGEDNDFKEDLDDSDDEDFPDARLESASESDGDGQSPERANPLLNGATTYEAGSSADEDAQAAQQHDDSTIYDSNEENAAKGNKRHMSARERRLLRKDPATATGEESKDPSASASTDEDSPPTNPDTSKPLTKSKPQVRGKQGKRKKQATKYAAQDDEDRLLAMERLGSAAKDKAAADAQAKAAKQKALEVQKARRREQHLRAAQEEARRQEQRNRGDHNDNEPASAADDDEERDHLPSDTPLDALIGAPLPGDELLAAIPVCAPWSALARYKYKAKLQPGMTKKGKAVREILGRWTGPPGSGGAGGGAGGGIKVDPQSTDPEKAWPRELELLRAWRDVEVLGVVPVGKVRVVMGGQGKGGGGKGGGGGGGGGKGKARGGKGSKKAR
ncbi:MAG: hypothetical protein M1833_003458 [Piccolia ochrophora]|nr:MAG: hypothetical protein M1833_003458 [Piccolia ochrophora]